MISFIRGTLADVYSDRVILENQGMGFEIFLTGADLGHMPLIGADLTLHTYLYVREDMMMLYGFRKREDLDTFKLLITVSGIGPKGALAILSVLPARELWMAVEMDDAKTIATAPGVGKKTAQKMIIELKDKMANLERSSYWNQAEESGVQNGLASEDTESGDAGSGNSESGDDSADVGAGTGNASAKGKGASSGKKQKAGSKEAQVSYREIQKDGIEALVALGYSRNEAVSAVRDVKAEELSSMDVESLLKKALRNLL